METVVLRFWNAIASHQMPAPHSQCSVWDIVSIAVFITKIKVGIMKLAVTLSKMEPVPCSIVKVFSVDSVEKAMHLLSTLSVSSVFHVTMCPCGPLFLCMSLLLMVH